MSKYTKGPWHTGGKGNIIVYDASGWAVCDAEVYHEADNSEANARLIAAAPELLEACKKAYDCILGYRLDGDDVAGELREIMAKAEGGDNA